MWHVLESAERDLTIYSIPETKDRGALSVGTFLWILCKIFLSIIKKSPLLFAEWTGGCVRIHRTERFRKQSYLWEVWSKDLGHRIKKTHWLGVYFTTTLERLKEGRFSTLCWFRPTNCYIILAIFPSRARPVPNLTVNPA